MKALIVGASGLIGNELLKAILGHPIYTSVVILVRKKLLIEHSKLTQLIFNFDNPDLNNDLLAVDVVFCTLGTTMKNAGSKEAFIKVDYEYPLLIAKLCVLKNIPQFHIVTAMGANLNSSIFYNQVKGRIENDIQQLGIKYTIIYRPSMLLGQRNEVRNGEKIGQVIMSFLDFAFVGSLKKYRAIKGTTVAQVMLQMSLKADNMHQVLESNNIENIYQTFHPIK